MIPVEPINMLTCRDAAAIAHCSHTTILRWAKAGKLPVAAKTSRGILLFRLPDVLQVAKRTEVAA